MTSFPDPNVYPEFTGENGITYSWDATDGKWVIKGFSTEEDPRYVKTTGDDMTGPIKLIDPSLITDDNHLVTKGYVDAQLQIAIETKARAYKAYDGPVGPKGEIYLGYMGGQRHTLNLSAVDLADQDRPDMASVNYMRIVGNGVNEVGVIEDGSYWLRSEPSRLQLVEGLTYLFRFY